MQSLKHLFPLPAWELGPGIQKFQNKEDGFLTKCPMVWCFFLLAVITVLELGNTLANSYFTGVF